LNQHGIQSLMTLGLHLHHPSQLVIHFFLYGARCNARVPVSSEKERKAPKKKLQQSSVVMFLINPISEPRHHLCLNLLAEDVLERHRVGGELGNALAQLLDGHLVLVEEEAELGLVVNVRLLLKVERAGLGRIQLLGDIVLRVVELLEQVGLSQKVSKFRQTMAHYTYGDGQVITASKLGNLTDASERRAHDDRLVAKLLVVVENVLDALDAGILGRRVLLLGRGLEPVKNAANKGRDEVGTGLGGGDGLGEREHERQVGVDAVLRLQDLRRLDALPGRGNLDENAVLLNADLLVELGKSASSRLASFTAGNVRR
jgi:hypothetical protein